MKETKVVILGQDPYHGPDQAHGLCFSVQKGTEAPPSLKNMYKELAADENVDFKNPGHGCLKGEGFLKHIGSTSLFWDTCVVFGTVEI